MTLSERVLGSPLLSCWQALAPSPRRQRAGSQPRLSQPQTAASQVTPQPCQRGQANPKTASTGKTQAPRPGRDHKHPTARSPSPGVWGLGSPAGIPGRGRALGTWREQGEQHGPEGERAFSRPRYPPALFPSSDASSDAPRHLSGTTEVKWLHERLFTERK